MSAYTDTFDATYGAQQYYTNNTFKQFAIALEEWADTAATGGATAKEKLLARTILPAGRSLGIAQEFIPTLLADTTFRTNLGGSTDANIKAAVDWIAPILSEIIEIPS